MVVCHAMTTIRDDRLRERAAAQAVQAYNRWLRETVEGRDVLLRAMLDAGYQVGVQGAE